MTNIYRLFYRAILAYANIPQKAMFNANYHSLCDNKIDIDWLCASLLDAHCNVLKCSQIKYQDFSSNAQVHIARYSLQNEFSPLQAVHGDKGICFKLFTD